MVLLLLIQFAIIWIMAILAFRKYRKLLVQAAAELDLDVRKELAASATVQRNFAIFGALLPFIAIAGIKISMGG
jgi:hypothetical protein